LVLDNIFSGKIRIALLTKLQKAHLIKGQQNSDNTEVKHDVVNQGNDMFKTLCGTIMQFVGSDDSI